VVLLRRIRSCLYDQGYTIKGVQKLLREGSLKADGHVASMMQPLPAAPDLRRPKQPPSDGLRAVLIELRKELVAIRDQLAKPRR
jgi:hypothetical protein